MYWLRRSLLALSLLAVGSHAHAADPFYLKPGDRVVFYGDSITEQSLYTTFTELYVVTRFPSMKISFTESGWSGDRVTGGGGGPIDLRLQRDAIPYQPTVMTVMLAMNDGSYRAYDEGIFNTYATGYRHILDVMKRSDPTLQMTLIQPSPFDDVTRAPSFEGGYNSVLVRYGDYLKELARERGFDVADLNTPVVAALTKANETDPATAQKIIPDRVHPGPGGHLLMAEALLKAWNAPATVSDVEIDAESGHVTRAENATVSRLRKGETLDWVEKDDALPYPLDMTDPVVALAINSSDFVEALDRQLLKVTGLAAPRYELQIDGAAVGTFTREQLGDGVNLALLATPMAAQAGEVRNLTRKHLDVHHRRWRQVQLYPPLQDDKDPGVQKSLDTLLRSLDREEAGLVDQQRKAALPREHRYTLRPVS